MCKGKKECTCSCGKKEIKESLLLEERINLNLSILKKRDLVKYSKTAHDSLLSMYEICHNSNVDNNEFLSLLDAAFSKMNEIVTVLVVQNPIDSTNKNTSIKKNK